MTSIEHLEHHLFELNNIKNPIVSVYIFKEAKEIHKQEKLDLEEYKNIINAIREGTGMSIKDAKRSLLDVRKDVVVICKQWYRENGKKI